MIPQRRTVTAPDEPCESGNELNECTKNLKIEFREQEITDTQNRDEPTGCTQSLKRRPHRRVETEERTRQEHSSSVETEQINGVGSMAEAHLKTPIHSVKQAANTIARTTEWQRKSADPDSHDTNVNTDRIQQDLLKTTTSGHLKVKILIQPLDT